MDRLESFLFLPTRIRYGVFMGKKGREIVKVDIKDLLKDLNSAYADEWIAFFYYNWAADFIEGPDYPTVASELDRIAKEEFEHLSDSLTESLSWAESQRETLRICRR